MIAHVLCSGPSLVHTWRGAPDGDLVIGVNRAAQYAKVQWLCAGDWETPLLFPLTFTVGLCSTADSIRFFRELSLKPKTPFPEEWKSVAWETLPCRLQYSGPTSLILAAHLGARKISVYGADMSGFNDFTGGAESGWDRNETRWTSERRLFDQAVGYCATQGIHVERL